MGDLTAAHNLRCGVDGCQQTGGRIIAGYCGMHRYRFLKYGDPGPAGKIRGGLGFWDRVSKGEGCWEWQGATDACGYGQLKVKGVAERTHRYAYIDTYGPIPPGMFVCHRCDNPPCVRPDHLFLGTPQDNVTDMVAKGRNWPRRAAS